MNERGVDSMWPGRPALRVLARRTSLARLPLLAVAALALAACAPTAEPGTSPTTNGGSDTQPAPPAAAPSTPAPSSAPAGSVLRVGIVGASESLDPRLADGEADMQVMFALMEPLLTLTPEYELRPRLATSWAVAEDGRSIRLDLRDDVQFHDGTAFTSEDVKFTLESALDGRNEGLVAHLDDVLEFVETPDAGTAIVRFNKPAAYALYDLAFIPIMPAEVGAEFGDRPIGTGPYAFDGRSSGDRIVVRAFEDYWGAASNFEAVEFHVFGSGAVGELVAAISAGRLDLAQAYLTGATVRQLTNDRRLSVTSVPGPSTEYVVMNPAVAPLDDPRVRSAISNLIPRERIVERVLGGRGFPTSTVLGEATPWSDGLQRPLFDPERSQALLDDAGVTIDRPLTLLTTDTNPVRAQIAQDLEQTFAQHGVPLSTEFDAFPKVLDRGFDGDFELLLLGSLYRGNPVRRVLSELQGGIFPVSLDASDRLVELAEEVTRIDVSSGPGAEAFREFLTLLADETAFAYIYMAPEQGVHQASLRGWGPHPIAGLAYQDLQLVGRK